MAFICGAPDCGKSSSTEAARTRHQGSCKLWEQYVQGTIEARQARSATSSAPKRKPSNKLRNLGKHLSNLREQKARVDDGKGNLSSSAGSLSLASGSRTQNDTSGDAPMPDFTHSPTSDHLTGNLDTPGTASPNLPPDTETGRGKRAIRLPARYRDILPEPLAPVENPDSAATAGGPPERILPRITLIVRDTFSTFVNSFGLWRSYLHRPRTIRIP
ncbi:hypothetical protein B0H10DRAFT_2231216 [Mycena sp. CBHHK59/15]|nr:hypothetical protein B0H10DRAFT_2231216 [Mycena sp. CBHHK59/15]